MGDMSAARADRRGERRTVIDAAYLEHQREWSNATFGPGRRIAGVCDHIRKELVEVEEDDGTLREWADVVILALDGATRAAEAEGMSMQVVLDLVAAKQAANEERTWPDWRTADPDRAIEHVRAHTWATVPEGHVVPGSGRIIGKHESGGTVYVTFDRTGCGGDIPLDAPGWREGCNEWSAGHRPDSLVPTQLHPRYGLIYPHPSPAGGSRYEGRSDG